MTQKDVQKHEIYKQMALESYNTKGERMKNKTLSQNGYKEMISAPMFDGLYYTVNQSESILLPRESNALYLIQRVRDEAHRFAITYHRDLRSKKLVEG